MSLPVHPRKVLLFVVLSLSDLGLTWLLLRQDGGRLYEGNPLAGWCLAAYGWPGLAAFKAATVAAVVGLAACIGRSRPRAGNRVVAFACAAAGVAVGYGCYLAGYGSRAAERAEAADVARLEEAAMSWRAVVSRTVDYGRRLHDLAADLGAGRCRLDEATRRLAEHPQARDPRWLDLLRRQYATATDEQCLAGNLIVNALVLMREDPAAAGRVAERLGREYRAAFGAGHTAPCPDWLALARVPGEPAPSPSLGVRPFAGPRMRRRPARSSPRARPVVSCGR
jgi:hypothetical protein